jgi:hypothetical protein
MRVALRPIESEPLDVSLDRGDVLHPLLCRVLFVEAQVAAAAEFLSQAHNSARWDFACPKLGKPFGSGGKRDRDARAAGLDVRLNGASNEIAGARARFFDVVLLRYLPSQAWSSSGGCATKRAHCSATTAPLTGCRRAIEAKAVIGR